MYPYESATKSDVDSFDTNDTESTGTTAPLASVHTTGCGLTTELTPAGFPHAASTPTGMLWASIASVLVPTFKYCVTSITTTLAELHATPWMGGVASPRLHDVGSETSLTRTKA